MNLYLFKGSPILDGELENYDLYVRCESSEGVAPIVVDHYDWDDGETVEEIIENHVALDWHIELIKTYPEPAPAAGAIPYSMVEAILHKAL